MRGETGKAAEWAVSPYAAEWAVSPCVSGTLSKNQVDMLLNTLPCPDAMPFLFSWKGLVEKASNSLPCVVPAHICEQCACRAWQAELTMVVAICWQVTLRQCH